MINVSKSAKKVMTQQRKKTKKYLSFSKKELLKIINITGTYLNLTRTEREGSRRHAAGFCFKTV